MTLRFVAKTTPKGEQSREAIGPKGQLYAFKSKGKAGEILLYGDIGEMGYFGGGIGAKDFAEELKALGAVDSIDIRIQSYGGDVFEGQTIYRLLVDHGATVTTHIDGIAASIASLIAMAGSTITIGESAEFMIHDAWTITGGDAAALRDVADHLDRTSEAMASIYADRSGNTQARVRDWMKEETRFIGREAKLSGFATNVAENLKLAACAVPDWVALAQMHGRFKATPVPMPDFSGEPRPLREAAMKKIEEMRARMTARQSSGRG